VPRDGAADASQLAIDGSKFKAVNNRDKNFTRAKMERRMAQIEESVARYLEQLDTADRQEPSEALQTKTNRLKKIETLKQQMRRLERLKVEMLATPERLARLLSASPAVIYGFKATADFAPTFISDNITSVFGYTPADYLADPPFWRDRVHPGDLVRIEEAISAFFHNGIHAVEYRFRHKDGSYRWVNDQQHLIRGVDGKPFEIVGSWSDITARKAAEEEKAARMFVSTSYS
jgi:PAS domain S-box-containing protein